MCRMRPSGIWRSTSLLRRVPSRLRIAQDRLLEKNFVAALGIATAPFRNVRTRAGAESCLCGTWRAPAVLKTRRLGYDGKGQRIVSKRRRSGAGALPNSVACRAILENFVDFAFEASVVAARARDGAFAAYDPPQNEHENHILRRSTVPAPSAAEVLQREAVAIARADCGSAGLCRRAGRRAVRGTDGEIAVNEIAPRVHNSGHWTHGSLRGQPVRAAYPRGRGLAAGRCLSAIPMR